MSDTPHAQHCLLAPKPAPSSPASARTFCGRLLMPVCSALLADSANFSFPFHPSQALCPLWHCLSLPPVRLCPPSSSPLAVLWVRSSAQQGMIYNWPPCSVRKRIHNFMQAQILFLLTWNVINVSSLFLNRWHLYLSCFFSLKAIFKPLTICRCKSVVGGGDGDDSVCM